MPSGISNTLNTRLHVSTVLTRLCGLKSKFPWASNERSQAFLCDFNSLGDHFPETSFLAPMQWDEVIHGKPYKYSHRRGSLHLPSRRKSYSSKDPNFLVLMRGRSLFHLIRQTPFSHQFDFKLHARHPFASILRYGRRNHAGSSIQRSKKCGSRKPTETKDTRAYRYHR